MEIGYLNSGNEIFVKIDFRSNGKMAENGSELKWWKIEENRDFQTFFSNTLFEKL